MMMYMAYARAGHGSECEAWANSAVSVQPPLADIAVPAGLHLAHEDDLETLDVDRGAEIVASVGAGIEDSLRGRGAEPEAGRDIDAIDPRTGGVRALVGGYDFKKSQFNRAVQARRNPGSAFKPIIYGAALEKGMTAAAIIDDAPVEYESGREKAWKPKNYDNIYRGSVTMREALTNSINVVSVKILESIGVTLFPPGISRGERRGVERANEGLHDEAG